MGRTTGAAAIFEATNEARQDQLNADQANTNHTE